MVDYVRYYTQYDVIPWATKYEPDFPTGNGWLESNFPENITNIDGTPVSAVVRVIIRSDNKQIDGRVVASVKSGQDGMWRVDGLHPNLKYDVVSRLGGYNDIIYSNITPMI